MNKSEFEKMVKDVRENKTASELNLEDVSLDAAQLAILAKELCANRSIKKLILDGNRIDDNGAVFLARALRRNTTLITLYLCTNSIGDMGAKALASAIAGNMTLKNLWLLNNNIRNVGAEAFCNAIKIPSALLELGLWVSHSSQWDANIDSVFNPGNEIVKDVRDDIEQTMGRRRLSRAVQNRTLLFSSICEKIAGYSFEVTPVAAPVVESGIHSVCRVM